MTHESPVRVSTLAFDDRLKVGWPLALDSYQRGFVWGPDKLLQLTSDLAEFAGQPDKTLPYYIGAVLLHRDVHQSRRFIIDGQQRITALSLLYHRATVHRQRARCSSIRGSPHDISVKGFRR